MNRFLVAHTPLGGSLWAYRLDGHEALGQLYEYTVHFKSEDADIDCQALIGEVAAIELEAQNNGKRYFSGQIVRFSALGKRGKHWLYQAIIAPKLWHASRRADFKIWQNLTAQDVGDEILGKNAIKYEWRLKNPLKSWEYKVQYGETDLDFLSRLLEHEGIYWWFEHSAAGETLILADHFTTPQPFAGYETVPYYPPDEAREDEDHWQDWHMARRPEPGQYTHRDWDFKKPAADLTTESSDPRGHLFDQYEIYQYPGNYTEPADGSHYAAARLEALQREQDRITLRGKVRGATPGYRFTLQHHPRSEQNRELLIISARHEAADNDYEARGDSGGVHYLVEVQAMPANRAWRALTPKQPPRARGPETAVIVGPPGEEIYTDEYGRVKVHFHWDRYGKKDGSDSCWIRVASAWAGSNYGHIHIPRIGQEVIVDYEYGDPDRPLITGRVYNAAQMPPWELPANKTQSGILTRSTKGGAPGAGMKDGAGDANAIRFEDARGAEQLWVHAQKDQLSEVENDEDKWVGNDRRKVIDRDEFSTIHRDRTEEVDRNEKINVHGCRTEEVDLDETITIHGNRTEEVDQSETITIHKNRRKTVDKNETDSIGKMKNEKIGIGFMQNIGIFRMNNIGVAHNVNVGMMMMTNTGMMRMDNVGMNHTHTVGKNFAHTVGTQYQLSVGGDGGASTITVDGTSIALAAKKITLTADEEITLCCGSSTVKLTPSLIEILSTLVRINC